MPRQAARLAPPLATTIDAIDAIGVLVSIPADGLKLPYIGVPSLDVGQRCLMFQEMNSWGLLSHLSLRID